MKNVNIYDQNKVYLTTSLILVLLVVKTFVEIVEERIF